MVTSQLDNSSFASMETRAVHRRAHVALLMSKLYTSTETYVGGV